MCVGVCVCIEHSRYMQSMVSECVCVDQSVQVSVLCFRARDCVCAYVFICTLCHLSTMYIATRIK